MLLNILSNNKLYNNNYLGSAAPYTKTFIIRGIGYRAAYIENLISDDQEFPFRCYLSIRVGHSFNLYMPIPELIGVKIIKRDRKLIIYGANKKQVNDYVNYVYKLRPPSVYTGRGIRIKKKVINVNWVKKILEKDAYFNGYLKK